ncbi:MAG: hypothetical protein A3F46_01545 [Legionellales bacterium RIFCSPHIGHO2_12_FULL_42_9]|nr:MAG: hypothetical protein A3F46_01545 [Legionellales bacterium RIFCSPHIGHO2_12_FULL_42_9]
MNLNKNNLTPLMKCVFKTIDSLYQSYMPFLQGGGLFLKTNEQYELGDFVLLHVSLLDDGTVYPISGKVAWITPKGAQANKPAGIGVQFIDDITRSCEQIAGLSRSALILEQRSAAYGVVCEQRSAENQGVTAKTVDLSTRPNDFCNKIEELLGDRLNSSKTTDTM